MLVMMVAVLLLMGSDPVQAWRIRLLNRASVGTQMGLHRISNYYLSPASSSSSFLPRAHTVKMMTAGDSVSTESSQPGKILEFSRLAFRCTIISWWFQIVLTVISTVILTFANTVRQSTSTQSFWASGFAFSSAGVIISLYSSLLTWKNSRMCKRLYTASNAAKSKFNLLRSFEFSVTISLVGMFITLLGAEQIVGTLASKVLSIQGIQPLIGAIGSQNSLQALDIFLVQANTNILLALFSPIVCYLGLQKASRE